LSPDRIDILQNLKIRYTQAAALNDPFESFPAIIQKDKSWFWDKHLKKIKLELTQLEIKQKSKRKQYTRARKKDFPRLYKRYKDESSLFEQAQSIIALDSSIEGYLSLSANCDNILMWSHYAQNHEGFVLGFDSNHEYFQHGVSKVIYSDQRPYFDPTQSKQDASIFYTKSKDWSYEEEYRKSMSFVKKVPLDNGNTLLPFPTDTPQKDDTRMKEIKLFPIPERCIKSITFGWKSSPKLIERTNDIIRHNGLEDIQMYKSHPHKSEYKLITTKL